MAEERPVFDAMGQKIDDIIVLADAVPVPNGRISVAFRKGDGRLVVSGHTENGLAGRYLDVRVRGGSQIEIRLYPEGDRA